MFICELDQIAMQTVYRRDYWRNICPVLYGETIRASIYLAKTKGEAEITQLVNDIEYTE